MLLSVIIPALDAAAVLPACLAALREGTEAGPALDIVVVDGGSADGTRVIAADGGARVISVGRGRGLQLSAGAAAAEGDWLLFLHSDTKLAPGWVAVVRAFIADPTHAHTAAAFRFALDDPAPAARLVEAAVAWRCRALGLAWGDQGLLLSAAFYRALGGFRPDPVMEDVDLVRRIGRRRQHLLDVAAVTSAGRYRRGGWMCRPLRNLTCLALYFLGAPRAMIARFYGY